VTDQLSGNQSKAIAWQARSASTSDRSSEVAQNSEAPNFPERLRIWGLLDLLG
jgi:hypothetical protein